MSLYDGDFFAEFDCEDEVFVKNGENTHNGWACYLILWVCRDGLVQVCIYYILHNCVMFLFFLSILIFEVIPVFFLSAVIQKLSG